MKKNRKEEIEEKCKEKEEEKRKRKNTDMKKHTIKTKNNIKFKTK